jgi:hypothetical protein
MATMTLHGKFIEVPRVLFYRRLHGHALSSNPLGQEARTFWTASDDRFVLPIWRFALADLKAIIRASLPAAEKARLLNASLRRMAWRWSDLTQDLRRLF